MDVSVDITQELKELVGQYKFPDDVAPAAAKVTGKFSVGRIDMALFNQIFFAANSSNAGWVGGGQTTGTKQQTPLPGESQTIPSSPGPYTVTVTNSAHFTEDLGVRYASNFQAFTKLATGSPAVGQYTVSSGTYTFASGDAGLGVYITYVWTPTGSTGYTVPLNQQLMGYGPTFELWLSEPYQQLTGSPNEYNGLHLWQCRISKMGNELKNTDYLKPSFEFQSYANASGYVGEFFQVVA